MNMVRPIRRARDTPKREGLSRNERRKAEDLGVTNAWEVGLQFRGTGSPLRTNWREANGAEISAADDTSFGSINIPTEDTDMFNTCKLRFGSASPGNLFYSAK